MAILKARSRAGGTGAFGPFRPKGVIASEAKQSREQQDWIASSQVLLAMTQYRTHHTAANPPRQAAWIIHRGIPIRGVVNDDKAFRLVTRLIASTLRAHACPGAAPNRRMVPHSLSLWERVGAVVPGL